MKYAAVSLSEIENWLQDKKGIIIHGFDVSAGIAYIVYE